MSVNEVLEAVKALSPKEREQVRALLDSLSNARITLVELVSANLKLKA